MAEQRDFYEVLGVSRTAVQDEIQRAYRKLARTYHPDVNKDPAADSRFKEIAEAYDVLSDPSTRQRYDAFGPQFRQVPEDADPSTWRGGAPSGGGGQRRRTRRGAPDQDVQFESGFGDIDIEDLLGGMFGSRGRGSWGPVAGADQEAELVLDVEEAYRGGRRTITLPGPTGPRTLEVAIPAGVIDGQRIRLSGQGAQGSSGADAGDLYLIVRIAPHRRYRLEGRDIHVTLPLSPWEAALGASVAVDTPGGEGKVRVKAGTSSGRRLRIRGRGMPNPNGKAGDVIAEVRIMVPPTLTDEERQLFEQLAATSNFDPRQSS
jgi:curved DNA-binding protein